MIKIVNLRNYVLNENEVLVKVDRSSVLGNPFYMKNESERDLVCDKYDKYLLEKLDSDDIEFRRELNRIYALVKRGNVVVLGCWCYPKRCHSESIKSLIESKL